MQPVALPPSESENRLLRLSDAQVLARWLNESRGNSRNRVLKLFDEMKDLGEGLTDLNELHDKIRSQAADRDKSGLTKFADRYKEMHKAVGGQLHEVNAALSRYAFRPSLVYTCVTDTRSHGFRPDPRGSTIQVGDWTLSEADVAMSLVRLYKTGDLSRVRLCAMCQKCWLVAAKRHYQFCSGGCRETFYTKSPGYNRRRAEIQKRYRERLKEYHETKKKFFPLDNKKGERR